MKSEMKKGGAERDWLRRMADAEGECGSIAAAGLAHDVGFVRAQPVSVPRVALGRFIEFARRSQQKTLDEFAREADVDLAELLTLEQGESEVVNPRTVFQLASVLRVKLGLLLELAGLAEIRNETLGTAALRFAANAEPTAPLSAHERAAFEEFVKVLAESSDGG